MRAPKRTPPQLEPLFAALETHEVAYVLTGSVAVMAYGVELQPNDLDVTPDLSHENLSRLVAVLEEIEARPQGFGYWTTGEDGERRWTSLPTTPERLAAWRPDLDDPRTLDHLFSSKYGDFDVVPELAGSYSNLCERAVERELEGHTLRVAHIDDLLSRLTLPRREKDGSRVRALREIQRSLGIEGAHDTDRGAQRG